MVLQLIKKFPAFYGTRKFITVLTSARHLSLSWANSIQSPQPLPNFWRSILILSSHLRLGLFSITVKKNVIFVQMKENIHRCFSWMVPHTEWSEQIRKVYNRVLGKILWLRRKINYKTKIVVICTLGQIWGWLNDRGRSGGGKQHDSARWKTHKKKNCWKRRQRVFNVENVGVGPRQCRQIFL